MNHETITPSRRELTPVICRKCGATLEAHYAAGLKDPYELECTGCMTVQEMPGMVEKAIKRQFAIARNAQRRRNGGR